MKSFENIPKYIFEMLDALLNNSYEAYIVGGAVRDLYMNTMPDDYDICTSARPEQVIEIFKNHYKIIETGIKHGTVTVFCNNEPVEITTFRVDGKYKDCRRPLSVNFTDSLKEDLSRRDFTINALAYNKTSGVVDCFGGIDDIGFKIIKCIGIPKERFSEDALRILRALRFSAKLDFSIEKSTSLAIKECNYLLKNIASERIFSELDQLFKKGKPHRLAFVLTEYKAVFEKILKITVDDDTYTIICGNVSEITDNSVNRMLYYLCSIVKDERDLLDNLSKLKVSNDFKNTAISVFRLTSSCGISSEIISVKKMILKYGVPDCLSAAQILSDINLNTSFLTHINAVISENSCVSMKQLAVTGDDIKNAFGIDGKAVGEILNSLLMLVIEDKVQNDKTHLLYKARDVFKSDNNVK